MWTRTLRKSLSENMAMDPNEFIKVLIVALNDKTIQNKLQDVISSDLKKEIAHLNDNLSKKDQVIKDLENKVSVLEFKYDELEQYSRRNSLRITGLSENDEDPCETTLNLFDRMDINPKISIEDIDRVHRVGPKRGDNPRQMLIKFANYRARHRVFKDRSVLRKDGCHPDRPWEQKKAATNKQTKEGPAAASAKDDPVQQQIFINEDLTKKRASLLWKARCNKRDGKINDCWSSDGLILVKNLQNKIIPIHSEEELNNV